MLPPLLLSASLVLFVFALASAGNAPAPERGLLAGEWSVEFANGVVETCAIRKDGTASESKSHRKSDGKAVDKDGAIVITFDDDRTERWTPVGKRMVVDHWYPSSQYPCGKPVLGNSDRER
jgi:hypothetical protein